MLVLKVISDNITKYIDLYSLSKEIVLLYREDGQEDISLSLFVNFNKDALLCCNFDKNLIIESIDEFRDHKKDMVSDKYLLLALECIKAWDEKNNNEYLESAEYIIDWLSDTLTEELVCINKEQIEFRNNNRLSVQMMERLISLKISSKDNANIAAINILIGNLDSFEESFNKLTAERKKEFIEYPIYSLLKTYQNK